MAAAANGLVDVKIVHAGAELLARAPTAAGVGEVPKKKASAQALSYFFKKGGEVPQ